MFHLERMLANDVLARIIFSNLSEFEARGRVGFPRDHSLYDDDDNVSSAYTVALERYPWEARFALNIECVVDAMDEEVIIWHLRRYCVGIFSLLHIEPEERLILAVCEAALEQNPRNVRWMHVRSCSAPTTSRSG